MNEVAWCYLEGFGTKKDKVSFRLAIGNRDYHASPDLPRATSSLHPERPACLCQLVNGSPRQSDGSSGCGAQQLGINEVFCKRRISAQNNPHPDTPSRTLSHEANVNRWTVRRRAILSSS